MSVPVALQPKGGTDAVATGVDSVCRAAVTNGVVAAAAWQPTAEAICEPRGSVIEAVQVLWRVQSDLIAADTELALAWARLGRAIGSYEAIIP